jgi:hypothetical protein
MVIDGFTKSIKGEQPKDNVEEEKDILPDSKYIDIILAFKIIDEAYEKYLKDKLSTTDTLIRDIKHKFRVNYTSSKKLKYKQ